MCSCALFDPCRPPHSLHALPSLLPAGPLNVKWRQWNLWKVAPSARWPSLLPCLYLHCPAWPGFQPVIAHDYDSLWGTLWCHLPLTPLCLPLFVTQFLTFLSHFCCLLLIFGFLFNLFFFWILGRMSSCCPVQSLEVRWRQMYCDWLISLRALSGLMSPAFPL